MKQHHILQVQQEPTSHHSHTASTTGPYLTPYILQVQQDPTSYHRNTAGTTGPYLPP